MERPKKLLRMLCAQVVDETGKLETVPPQLDLIVRFVGCMNTVEMVRMADMVRSLSGNHRRRWADLIRAIKGDDWDDWDE